MADAFSGGGTISSAVLENLGTGTISDSAISLQQTTSGSSPLGVFRNDARAVITIGSNGGGSFGTITGQGRGSEIINAGDIVLRGSTYSTAGYAPTIAVDQIVNSGTIESQGAYTSVSGTTSGTGTFLIDSSADLTLNGLITGNSISFNPGGSATLQVNDLVNFLTDQQEFNASIAGFTPTDVIDIPASGIGTFTTITAATPSAYDASTNTTPLALTDDANLVATLTLSGDYANSTFNVSQSPSTGVFALSEAPCFCRGTRILTDRGECPVEALSTGDRVLTSSGLPRPIRWIGRRHLNLRRHPDPEIAQPILIRAHAVADNVPHRDLRVSPDHALLLHDMLIPARLLVNGASIMRETHCNAVTYYHVELDAHDILLAENLPTESYLDTGNRTMFENADATLMLHPRFDSDQRCRIGKSCRPFGDDAARVEPIWHRLAERAGRLGFDLPPSPETSGDPDLHLIVGGNRINPAAISADRYAFALPATEGAAHLISRATRPCDLRPWLEDRRLLGVMVAKLTRRRGSIITPIPLDHPCLVEGWWSIERDRSSLWRWTNGHALVPLSGRKPGVLEVTLARVLDYLIRSTESAASVADRFVQHGD